MLKYHRHFDNQISDGQLALSDSLPYLLENSSLRSSILPPKLDAN